MNGFERQSTYIVWAKGQLSSDKILEGFINMFSIWMLWFEFYYLGGFQFVDFIITELKGHINLSALIGENLFVKKNPLQDLLSSLNAVISTNERSWILKFVFSEKATKNDEIFTIDLTLST